MWKLRLRFENVGEERKNFCELLNWALIWSCLYHHIKSSVLCSKLYEFQFGGAEVWQGDSLLICRTWFFSVCLTKLQMSAKTLNLKRMNRLSTIDKKCTLSSLKNCTKFSLPANLVFLWNCQTTKLYKVLLKKYYKDWLYCKKVYCNTSHSNSQLFGVTTFAFVLLVL